MANRYSDFRVYRVKDMHVCVNCRLKITGMPL